MPGQQQASLAILHRNNLIYIFHHTADPCPSILPTIASERNTFPNYRFPAKAALIDSITEGSLPGQPGQFNYWAGENIGGQEQGFVVDLGCRKTIDKIELRNMQNKPEHG